ncbi:MAG: hypothetical protein ABI629_00260 [bacterium]
MMLAARLVALLERDGVTAAIIGGVALGAHGIARATLDTDILVADRRVLATTYWPRRRGIPSPDIRRGDADDPLAGVVSFASEDERIDLIVGRGAWMRVMLERRLWVGTGSPKLPIVDRADLILLKLYAGSPQDLLDVRLLLQTDPATLRNEVNARLRDVPATAVRAWQRLNH